MADAEQVRAALQLRLRLPFQLQRERFAAADPARGLVRAEVALRPQQELRWCADLKMLIALAARGVALD